MPRQTDARERMIKTTARLFRRQGFHGTGLQQVLADSGAPRGSLYFHFPDGKHQLTEEAIRYETAAIGRRLRRMLEDERSPAEAVSLMFGVYADWLERSDFSEGCPVAAVALDLTPGWESVREACREAFEQWTNLLAERFGRERAQLVLASLEGALVLARGGRTAEPMRTIGRQLAEFFA
jgi:TetR/AcrR family transcriptional regulator, lmrAB and yxaGH operons repressor